MGSPSWSGGPAAAQRHTAVTQPASQRDTGQSLSLPRSLQPAGLPARHRVTPNQAQCDIIQRSLCGLEFLEQVERFHWPPFTSHHLILTRCCLIRRTDKMTAVARLTILSIIIVTAQCNSNNEIHSMSQIKKKEAAFKACIDDSDCVDQGSDYACFQYICYPWEDDSAVPKKDKRATCKSQDQCSAGLECFRHHDRRNIHKGLCMEPIADCSENGDSDCKHGAKRSCCNGQYCCEEEYFNQLKELPCFNDQGCKDMGYGNYCCPRTGANNTVQPKVCCNTNPNPTTTTTTTTQAPKKSPATGAASLAKSSIHLFLLLLFVAAFKQ